MRGREVRGAGTSKQCGADGAPARSAAVSVGAQGSLTPQDRAEIQDLTARYARALGSCAAEEYADLFAPESGYFASNIRGEVVGRERLMALVRSERHCTTPPANAGAQAGTAPRPVPTVAIEISSTGPIGRADLGAAGQYDDEYVKTAKGWRFKSRTVMTGPGAQGKPDRSGRQSHSPPGRNRPRTVRGRVRRRGRRREALPCVGRGARAVAEGVTGRAYLKANGGHYEDVYVRTPEGGWRFKSRVHVADAPSAARRAGRLRRRRARLDERVSDRQ